MCSFCKRFDLEMKKKEIWHFARCTQRRHCMFTGWSVHRIVLNSSPAAWQANRTYAIRWQLMKLTIFRLINFKCGFSSFGWLRATCTASVTALVCSSLRLIRQVRAENKRVKTIFPHKKALQISVLQSALYRPNHFFRIVECRLLRQ